MVGEVFTQQKLTARFSQVLDKARRKNVEFSREFLREFGKELVSRTPVDTGQLKGSWYVSLNTRAFPGEPKLEPSPLGTASQVTLDRLNQTIVEYDGKQRLSFRNIAPYAYRMEFGFTGTDSLGRDYDFAPSQAYVRPTINNAAAIAERAAQKVKQST